MRARRRTAISGRVPGEGLQTCGRFFRWVSCRPSRWCLPLPSAKPCTAVHQVDARVKSAAPQWGMNACLRPATAIAPAPGHGVREGIAARGAREPGVRIAAPAGPPPMVRRWCTLPISADPSEGRTRRDAPERVARPARARVRPGTPAACHYPAGDGGRIGAEGVVTGGKSGLAASGGKGFAKNAAREAFVTGWYGAATTELPPAAWSADADVGAERRNPVPYRGRRDVLRADAPPKAR